jgi:hypothetical protein
MSVGEFGHHGNSIDRPWPFTYLPFNSIGIRNGLVESRRTLHLNARECLVKFRTDRDPKGVEDGNHQTCFQKKGIEEPT